MSFSGAAKTVTHNLCFCMESAKSLRSFAHGYFKRILCEYRRKSSITCVYAVLKFVKISGFVVFLFAGIRVHLKFLLGLSTCYSDLLMPYDIIIGNGRPWKPG